MQRKGGGGGAPHRGRTRRTRSRWRSSRLNLGAAEGDFPAVEVVNGRRDDDDDRGERTRTRAQTRAHIVYSFIHSPLFVCNRSLYAFTPLDASFGCCTVGVGPRPICHFHRVRTPTRRRRDMRASSSSSARARARACAPSPRERARLARVARRRRDNPCASPTRIASTFEPTPRRETRARRLRGTSPRERRSGVIPRARVRRWISARARRSTTDGSRWPSAWETPDETPSARRCPSSRVDACDSSSMFRERARAAMGGGGERTRRARDAGVLLVALGQGGERERVGKKGSSRRVNGGSDASMTASTSDEVDFDATRGARAGLGACATWTDAAQRTQSAFSPADSVHAKGF